MLLAAWMQCSLLLLAVSAQGLNFRPRFSMQALVKTFKESEGKGYIVDTISDYAIDDEGDTIVYSLDEEGAAICTIDPVNGSLRLDGPLDREVQSSYTFNVLASDDPGQGPSRQAPMAIYLILVDINDNPPLFEETPYTTRVLENATVGTTLLVVTATDRDTGMNGDVRYTMRNETMANSFHVDNVFGIVTLVKQLDYEARREYTLIVMAQDQGESPLISITTIVVTVGDVADTPPRFRSLSYEATLDENTQAVTSLLRVDAFDGDTAINNSIRYEIENGSGNALQLFAVDNVLGVLTSIAAIDREQHAEIYLRLKAYEMVDSASSSLVDVRIAINDVNDNRPQFVKDEYSTIINEGVPIGFTVFDVLSAKDNDSSVTNSRLRYELQGSDSNYFKLNANTSHLTTDLPLDFERKSNFSFQVVATESLSLEHYSTTTNILVRLRNRNDNRPTFVKSLFDLVLPEDVSIGSVVANISAYDDDAGEFGHISYKLSGRGYEHFSISPDGVLITNASLDFEVTKEFDLNVTAQDGGNETESHMTSAQVHITVTDVNDNSPVFEASEYKTSVYENASESTSVLTLRATDADSSTATNHNGNVRYELIEGDFSGDFELDPEDGILTTAKPLDRELRSHYNLTVVASDGGTPSLNSTIVVHVDVGDVNDHSPEFEKDDYAVQIREDVRINSSVIWIEASDPDTGNNSLLFYTISSGDHDGHFRLDNNGSIYVAKQLDRETSSSYSLSLRVVDFGNPPLSSVVIVNITVLDINDNKPIFSVPRYVSAISEDAAPFSFVVKVTASDDDEGNNGSIIFSFEEDSTPFAINATSGEISTILSLDREIRNIYVVNVTASDQGHPRLLATAIVEIHVNDVNDNAPEFHNLPAAINVSEAAEVGSHVVKIAATDRDMNNTVPLRYSIVSEGQFTINSGTGMVTLETPLDRESRDRFNVVVMATDGGAIPLTSTATVMILVTDVNDETPMFTGPGHATIEEHVPVGTTVLNITAIDLDAGLNRVIIYTILHGNENASFTLEADTGELRTNQQLIFARKKEYILQIEAKDSGVSPLSSTRLFNISVVNIVNSRPPTFSENEVSASINENVAPNSFVARITARDPDGEPIYYHILEGNSDGAFFLVKETGVLVTTISLDRERIQTYTLQVMATNSKNRPPIRRRKDLSFPLTNDPQVQTVNIQVQDENDNEPRFKDQEYRAGISQDAMQGTPVVICSASDLDTGESHVLVYSITGGNEANIFTIEPYTGRILTSELLSNWNGDNIEMVVTVKDNGGQAPYLVDLTTVKVFFVSDTQRIILTMTVSISLIQGNKKEFLETIANATGFIITIDSIQHSTADGRFDSTSTDVVIHAQDPSTSKIIPRDDVIAALNSHHEQLNAFFQKWNVTSVKPKFSPTVLEQRSSSITMALIAIAVSLVIILIIFILVVWKVRKRQKRCTIAKSLAKYQPEITLTSMDIYGENPVSSPMRRPLNKAEEDIRANPVRLEPHEGWHAKEKEQAARSALRRHLPSYFAVDRGLTETYVPNMYGEYEYDSSEDNRSQDTSGSWESDVKQAPRLSQPELLMVACLEGLGTKEENGVLVTSI